MVEDWSENSVIGADKILASAAYGEYCSLRTDLGIDDNHMYSIRREITVCPDQKMRRRTNGLWWNKMADVNNSGIRDMAENDALHDPDVFILKPEIGEKGDDWLHIIPGTRYPVLGHGNTSRAWLI